MRVDLARELARRGHLVAGHSWDHRYPQQVKGGWTTRHYGRPETGVHAIQMELAQSSHLASEAPPFAYDEAKAAALRVPLADILKRIAAFAPELKA